MYCTAVLYIVTIRYRARHKLTGLEIALKSLSISDDGSNDEDINRLKEEMEVTRVFDDNEYVVRYHGVVSDDKGAIWVVMELCDVGSLSDVMVINESALDEAQLKCVLYQVTVSLDYLHNARRMHRDVKGGNILLDRSGHAKLGAYRGVGDDDDDQLTLVALRN